MDFARFAETIGRVLRSNIALRHSEHFEADHKFLDGCGAQERREIVRVQMPFGMRRAVGGALVKTHRIGKGNLKQIVVANGDAAENVAKQRELSSGEGRNGVDVSAADDDRFKRPHRPIRNQDHKGIVVADDSLFALELEAQVIAQQASSVAGAVLQQGLRFAGGYVRDAFGSPNLAMRMRIAGAHQGAAVLEHLDVTNPAARFELRILLREGIQGVAQFGVVHSRYGEIVARRKAYDAADAALALGLQQTVA